LGWGVKMNLNKEQYKKLGLFLDRHGLTNESIYYVEQPSRTERQHICTIKRGCGSDDFFKRLLSALNEEYDFNFEKIESMDYYSSLNVLSLRVASMDGGIDETIEIGHSWIY